MHVKVFRVLVFAEISEHPGRPVLGLNLGSDSGHHGKEFSHQRLIGCC
jgi:hypothetical protein